MQQSPGDQLGRRPGVGVRPKIKLVHHPCQHADGRIVHGISESLSFGGLDVSIGAISGHEPSLEALKAALFEGGVGWFTVGKGWFGERKLGRP